MSYLGRFDGPSVRYKPKRGVDPFIGPKFERDLKEIVDVCDCDPRDRWGLAGVDVDTTYINVAKYQREQPSDVDVVAWKKSVATVTMVYKRSVRNPVEWDFEKAVSVLPKSTSSGPDMARFGQSKGEVLEDPLAVEELREYDSKQHYRTLQRAVPKEEIRPMDKVVRGDNRSILVVGMPSLITECRLWGDQNRQLAEHWQESRNPVKIGMTPFYGGWHEVIKPFVGRKVGSFDVSQRDSSASRLHQEAMLSVRLSLYDNVTDEFIERASKNASDSTYGCITMPDGAVFEKDTGNSTGKFCTISDNCGYSLFDLFYALHKLFPSVSSHDMLEMFLTAVVGDDVLVSPKDDIADLVDPNFITEVLLKDLGVRIKWERPGWSDIFSLSWLSTRTTYMEGGWLIPVPEDPSKMLASCYYGAVGFTALDTLRRLVNFRMLSFTSPAIFEILDRWTRELIDENQKELRNVKEWNDLVDTLMTRENLLHLYTGWEGSLTPPVGAAPSDDCMDSFPWLSSLRPAVTWQSPPIPVTPSLKEPQINKDYLIPHTVGTIRRRQRCIGRLWVFIGILLLYIGAFLSLSPQGLPNYLGNALTFREPSYQARVIGVSVDPSMGRGMPSFEAVALNTNMTKKHKKPKVKSEKHKQKRKEARKRRKANHRADVIAARANGAVIRGNGDYQQRPDKRMASRLHGRGDFFGDLWDGAKNIASKGISAAGWVADNAGWLSSLVGAGDYRVGKAPKHNSLFRGSSVPMIQNSFMPTIVRHREYIGEIIAYNGTGGTSIQNRSFNINPGLQASAPWLAGIADQFQEYFLLGAAVEYQTEQTAISTNSVGSVVISPRYDVTLPAPVSSIQVLNMEGKVEGRPVDNLLMAIECDPAMRPVEILQVRTGALPSGAALQLFDHCIVDVTNWGQASSSGVIGHLYLSLEVGLLMPVDLDATNGDILSDHYLLSTVTSANNLGTTAAATSTSTLGGSVTAGATAKYAFPSYVSAGQYLVVLNYAHSSSATVTAPTITGTNCTKVTMWATSGGFDLTSGATAPPAGTSTGTQTAAFILTINDSIASFTVSGLTFAGTCYGDLMITPFNGNMVTLARNKWRWGKHWEALDREEKVRAVQSEEIAERTFRRMIEEMFKTQPEFFKVESFSDDEKDFEKLTKPKLPGQLSPRSVINRTGAMLQRALRNSPPVQADAPQGAPKHG